MPEFTFLTEEQIWGDENGNGQLDVMKRYGTKVAQTDLSAILGGYMTDDLDNRTSEGDLTCISLSSSSYGKGRVGTVDIFGKECGFYPTCREIPARPALSPAEAPKIRPENVKTGVNGVKICEYGEYPQTVADDTTSSQLESLFQSKTLSATGKNYTFDSIGIANPVSSFEPISYPEYEMDGKRYIRVPGRFTVRHNPILVEGYNHLSTGKQVEKEKHYWVEVEPIEWLMDKSGWMISKKCLFTGIQFDAEEKYDGKFENSFIKRYLDGYFAEEIKRNGKKWENTWETIDWEKDPEDEIIQKIKDFYYAGVDFNMKTFWCGETPLMFAARHSTPRVLDLLIDGGADPSFKDKNFGITALHYATMFDKLENVKYLVEHGPQNFVDVKDKRGETALDYAIRNPDVAEYLKSCSQNSLQQTLSDTSQKPNKVSLIKKTKTR